MMVDSGSMAFMRYRVRVGKRRPKSDCERWAEEGMVKSLGAVTSTSAGDFDLTAGIEGERDVVEDEGEAVAWELGMEEDEEGDGSRDAEAEAVGDECSSSVGIVGAGRTSASRSAGADTSGSSSALLGGVEM